MKTPLKMLSPVLLHGNVLFHTFVSSYPTLPSFPSGTRHTAPCRSLFPHSLTFYRTPLTLPVIQTNTLALCPAAQYVKPQANPMIWDTKCPSVASHHPAGALREAAQVATVTQGPLSAGLQAIIACLLQEHILIPTCSPHSTPILPVKKPAGLIGLYKNLGK